MLTEKDLMLIGALIDSRLDARFDAFEIRIDRKLRELEDRIYRRIDEKFDEFAGVIKKSFDEVFLRLDRIENPTDVEDHPSWR